MIRSHAHRSRNADTNARNNHDKKRKKVNYIFIAMFERA